MTTLPEVKPAKKTAQAAQSLRELVESAGPDTKLPTYLELLSSLSVSRTTLNAALDELESQRVIYRRHGVGIFTAPSTRAQTIALVCNPLYFQGRNHSPFWDVLLAAARERAAMDDASCEVHFCKVQDPDHVPFSENLMHSLRSGHIHGVAGVGMNRKTRDWLRENRIHYVSFGSPGDWYIGIDRSGIIHQGVRLLGGHGCRRVALLSPVDPFKSHTSNESKFELWTEVFRMALDFQGLAFSPNRLALNSDLVSTEPFRTDLSHQEQGHRSIHKMFSGDVAERPDGLLFTDDVMAVGGLAALRELGIDPREDVRVVTHANKGMSILQSYEAVVTRLEVDPQEIVDTLFSAIHDLVAGQTPVDFHFNPATQEFQYLARPVLHEPIEPAS